MQQILEKKQIAYEMQIYPGVGHGFSGEIWRDAGLRTLAFLKKHLGAGESSPVQERPSRSSAPRTRPRFPKH